MKLLGERELLKEVLPVRPRPASSWVQGQKEARKGTEASKLTLVP